MSESSDAIVNLLALARTARVRLWPDGESIHYRSPDPLSQELKTAILANKAELLVALAVWDGPEASWLASEADGLASELFISGMDPELQRAGALAAWGLWCEVMPAVRKGCALVEDRARKLVRLPLAA